MIELFQKKWQIVLASTSPRRRQLLGNLGLQFECIAPDFEEKAQPGEKPDAYALRNSMGKALAVQKAHSSKWARPTLVLGSDTIVVLDDKIYEKPVDKADASRILNELSGREHRVLTGCAFVEWADGKVARQVSFIDETLVRFKVMKQREIDFYLLSDEAMDKAGAYGVQSAYFVEGIQGSFSGVMGLPLCSLYKQMEQWL